jgi:hypothetical protein
MATFGSYFTGNYSTARLRSRIVCSDAEHNYRREKRGPSHLRNQSGSGEPVPNVAGPRQNDQLERTSSALLRCIARAMNASGSLFPQLTHILWKRRLSSTIDIEKSSPEVRIQFVDRSVFEEHTSDVAYRDLGTVSQKAGRRNATHDHTYCFFHAFSRVFCGSLVDMLGSHDESLSLVDARVGY